jgi:hypothetical protein
MVDLLLIFSFYEQEEKYSKDITACVDTRENASFIH